MKIRTIIVGRSDSSQEELSHILESERTIDLASVLSEEDDMVEMAGWIKPDVVLIDIRVFKKKAFVFFKHLLKSRIPVIVTGNGKDTSREDCIELLEQGALDFIPLPKPKEEIIGKIKNASKATPIRLKEHLSTIKVRFPDADNIWKVIVIASSMGGPQALREIIPKIPGNIPAAILIVQHMGRGFTGPLAKSLEMISKIGVKVAEEGESLVKGIAYFAPHGHHLYIKDSKIELVKGKPINGVMPSADYTMRSVAENFGRDSIGFILTGMGKDGASGAEEIKKRGGRVIVQDKRSSVIFGMPQAALKTGAVDRVVGLEKISEVLVREVSG